MRRSLRLLMIEDSPDDALLVQRLLEKAGHDVAFERVESAPAFRGALAKGRWDAILSDHSMPGFSAPEALKLLAETGLDVPFLIVSGHIGEDAAVLAMKLGAHDYIPKDKLPRLVPALERELKDAEARRARKEAEREARERESFLRAVMESAADGIFAFNAEGKIAAFNGAAERIFGYTSQEVFGQDVSKLLPVPVARLLGKGPRELYGRRKNGEFFPMEIAINAPEPGGIGVGTVRDVGARKSLERQLRQAQRWEGLGSAVRETAEEFQRALQELLRTMEAAGKTTPSDATRARELQEIHTRATHVADLGRRLSSLPGRTMEFGRCDVGEILRAAEPALRETLGPEFRLAIEIAPRMRPAFAEAPEVEKVLTLLCQHAREVMPRGGEIRVEARDTSIDAAFCRNHESARPGEFVRVSVSCGRGAPLSVGAEPEGQLPPRASAEIRDLLFRRKGFFEIDGQRPDRTTVEVYFPAG